MFGHPLFTRLPANRTCGDAGVPEQWCSWNQVTAPAQLPENMIMGLGDALVGQVNKLASAGIHSGVCVPLPSVHRSKPSEWADDVRASVDARSVEKNGYNFVNLIVTFQGDMSGGRCTDDLSFAAEYQFLLNNPSRLGSPSPVMRVSPFSHETCVKSGRQYCVCRREGTSQALKGNTA